MAFTDRASGDDPDFTRAAAALGVRAVSTMRQVHGPRVAEVTSSTPEPPVCDALVTREPGVALCVRVADCIPLVLADVGSGVVAAAHAGRVGVAAGVIVATVAAMRRLGADEISAWVGPHICGSCYEVPAQMRADVSSALPAAFACTTWGSPSLDLGAAATAQLVAAGVVVHDRSRCTRESLDLYSYRRDGARSGRAAGLVVLHGQDREVRHG